MWYTPQTFVVKLSMLLKNQPEQGLNGQQYRFGRADHLRYSPMPTKCRQFLWRLYDKNPKLLDTNWITLQLVQGLNGQQYRFDQGFHRGSCPTPKEYR
jgi:hypothetical protein